MATLGPDGLADWCWIDDYQVSVLQLEPTNAILTFHSNIGHDVQALWNYWDKGADKDFVAHRQLWHVSIISICSFLGRLSSGIGSDVIVKRLHHSRFWCAAISASIFALGQIAAIQVENPNLLWTVPSGGGGGGNMYVPLSSAGTTACFLSLSRFTPTLPTHASCCLREVECFCHLSQTLFSGFVRSVGLYTGC